MGKSPCCEKVGLKKGSWTPEEDQKLLAYIEEHGHGSWRALPGKAGLQRCGKSCRLRWTNYLRPDIKRGKFSLQEEQTIVQLHALLGNRWSAIATHLPNRTDNEIKNYWNTHLKKRLTKMGIDPVTHKHKHEALFSSDGQSKNAANLSHMAQWESARLEAEARLVRESKLRSRSFQHQVSTSRYVPDPGSGSAIAQPPTSPDVLKAWNGPAWSKSTDLESPTSTLTLSENAPPIMDSAIGENSIPPIEFVGTSGGSETGITNDEGEHNWKGLTISSHLPENLVSFTSNIHEVAISMEGAWAPESLRTSSGHVPAEKVMEEGFTGLLLSDSAEQHLAEGGKESENSGGSGGGSGSSYSEDNKNYWNSILNLVNVSPSDSPMF